MSKNFEIKKTVVADIVPHKVAVDYGVKPRERERHGGRQYETKELFEHAVYLRG